MPLPKRRCPVLLPAQGFRTIRVVRGRNTTAFVAYETIEDAVKAHNANQVRARAHEHSTLPSLPLSHHTLQPARPPARLPGTRAQRVHPLTTGAHARLQGALLASNAERGGIRIEYSRNPFGKKRDVTGIMIDTPVREAGYTPAPGARPAGGPSPSCVCVGLQQ